MANDNTSVETPDKAPSEKDTLESVESSEPVNAAEDAETALEKRGSELIFGKYETLEAAQEAYGNIQARATKAEQAYKELKKELEGKSREEIKSLDYDKQLDYLVEKLHEAQDKLREFEDWKSSESQSAALESDAVAIKSFITKHPLLVETGLDEEFRLIATHPTMQDYTLESIYEARIRPKLEKLMGTKITTKERKLVGSSAKTGPDFKDVSSMSLAEYEKYRREIHASAGIK